MENKKETRPTTNSMTSEPACYYSSCNGTPKWSITSMTRIKQPDGKSLKLYTCDVHYTNLTGDLRKAVTRYTLAPINGPHMVPPHMVPPPITPEERFEGPIRGRSVFYRAFCYSCVAVVFVVIGPPMTIYYGAQWFGSWVYRKWKGK